jgi:hypothetical protein
VQNESSTFISYFTIVREALFFFLKKPPLVRISKKIHTRKPKQSNQKEEQVRNLSSKQKRSCEVFMPPGRRFPVGF